MVEELLSCELLVLDVFIAVLIFLILYLKRQGLGPLFFVIQGWINFAGVYKHDAVSDGNGGVIVAVLLEQAEVAVIDPEQRLHTLDVLTVFGFDDCLFFLVG